jgi:hypothetical protein
MASSLDNRDLRHTTAKLSIQMGSFGCSRGELTHAAPQNVRRFVSRQSVNISVLRLPAPSAFGGSHRNDFGRGWTGSSIDLRTPVSRGLEVTSVLKYGRCFRSSSSSIVNREVIIVEVT